MRSGLERGPQTWYVYLMLGFFGFVLNLQGNIVPLLKSELGLSYRTVGLHASAVAAGLMSTGLSGTPLLRRLGRRRAMWLGALGLALGTLLLCAARVPQWTIAACALIGAVGGLVPVVVSTALADIHGERRDVAYAEANAASYLFSILGPLGIGAALALGVDWRYALVAGAALGLLVVAWFRRVRLPDAQPLAQQASARLARAYWLYWLTLGLGVGIEYGMLLWAPEFLERVAGLRRSAAAAGAASFMLAMVVGRIAGGRLLRSVSAPRLLRASLWVVVAGFIVYAVLGDAQRVGPTMAAVSAIVGLFLAGLGVAPLYPLTLALAVRAAGPLSSLAAARTTLASGGAILLMPTLLGGAADEVGLRGAVWIVPALAVAALAAVAAADGRVAGTRFPAAVFRGRLRRAR
ncbi:MAG TPA: MFS transporter [Burkholderiaceae bacterium]|nr:MFS transporter [Burkholderiaceae bacterium]